MPVITLPDGSQKQYDQPVTVMDVATDIGPGLAKATLAGEVDGRLRDASYRIEEEQWAESGCEELEIVELQVGVDASVVVVSADTPFIGIAEPITRTGRRTAARDRINRGNAARRRRTRQRRAARRRRSFCPCPTTRC